jgi:hypothetical protein
VKGESESHIGVNAALMEFVENHQAHSLERRIGLKETG